MTKVMKAGLVGCGDYLRWLIEDMNASKLIKVKSTYDIIKEKSVLRANQLNAISVDSADAIFNDPEIDVVYIFTPPWARIELFEKAVKNKKHIISTKPLASNYSDAKKIVQIVNNHVKCAIFYGRTGNAVVEKLKQIFESDEIGQLAIYKEDWLHHYPTWNNWATDTKKNGGPFMDAMIHNLNKARFLVGSKINNFYFFSNTYAQKLACNDTESMKVFFENGAIADLFITWAADLPVFDPKGNDREHIGISHLITNKGWYLQEVNEDGKTIIRAKKEQMIKEWVVKQLPHTPYDNFALSVINNTPTSFDIETALEDIKIISMGMEQPNLKLFLS